jgi:hypothetical protein
MAPGFVAVLQMIAVICSGIFAGAAIYINLVEHPARMEGGAAPALAEWAPSYRRATLMQAPLALIGGLAVLGAWLAGAGHGWAGSSSGVSCPSPSSPSCRRTGRSSPRTPSETCPGQPCF